jgi:hypothetical protein
MMIMWLVLAGYLAGILAGSRVAIRMRMERPICSKGDRFLDRSKGDRFLDLCREYHGAKCAVPAGQLRPRQMEDGAVALVMGLAWPVVVAIYAIMHTTPPTPGEARRLLAEQERRIESQAKDIERLTRMIGTHEVIQP